MARIVNFGSINIDHVYAVPHFVRPGETLGSAGYARHAGGKGFNQSVALARAGARVSHAGRIGEDGLWLRERLTKEGVDVSRVSVGSDPTGHAIIQVIPQGENAIVTHGGANHAIDREAAKEAVAGFGPGDWLLLQNETSGADTAMATAIARGMSVALNPAPVSAIVAGHPLDRVTLMIVNETEAAELLGCAEPAAVAAAARKAWPRTQVVLTLGARGACFLDGGHVHHQPAERVTAVDTTAAGDTFIGFFLGAFLGGATPADAMATATRAAAICVTRPGASDSIPRRDEL